MVAASKKGKANVSTKEPKGPTTNLINNTKSESQCRYQVPADDDEASKHLQEFISEADQPDVLNFAYKAKMLHQGQRIGENIDQMKTTLANIESTEAYTASQLSSLTAYEEDAQEKLSSRLDDIGSTVRNTSNDVKSFQSTMTEFGATMSKIEFLESQIANSVSEKLTSHLETFTAEVREPEQRLSKELVSHLKETHAKISSLSDTMENMEMKTNTLNSRLEAVLETIPKELQSLRNTLKEANTFQLLPTENKAEPKEKQTPQNCMSAYKYLPSVLVNSLTNR
ncbi:hypothetical protein CFIMG_008369RA00001 [Ceratocystis fimbriata CBS 114723]|uniref:Uncharacterized protein n=1 Tax=Ceratocystis fimbriata CBS 114723 TaxID=1035309 RepID=A0A2C5X481_9PEZI|nr:hypothetical protein CFIMG_008369RA00001 [Ceratocystis fimbriata CBS 114723]